MTKGGKRYGPKDVILWPGNALSNARISMICSSVRRRLGPGLCLGLALPARLRFFGDLGADCSTHGFANTVHALNEISHVFSAFPYPLYFHFAIKL